MTEILKTLLAKIEKSQPQIDQFFASKLINPLFYNSLDLRHSGFKIAPVDVNCFPAGFNNLSSISKEIAKKNVADFFNKKFPTANKIAIIPENHTRNLRYLENILALQEIVADGGKREVKIISLILEI